MAAPKTTRGLMRQQERRSVRKSIGTGDQMREIMRELRAVYTSEPAKSSRVQAVFDKFEIRPALAVRILGLLPRNMRMRFYVRENNLPLPKRLSKEG